MQSWKTSNPRAPGRSRFPSEAYRRMMDWVGRIASTNLPVLVQGESGCGKEEISRALHRLSARSSGPFVAINCTALAETLLEAELFGAVRGAYTGSDRDRPGLFRQAHGGTLFLDEVGDMPPPMQAKLLPQRYRRQSFRAQPGGQQGPRVPAFDRPAQHQQCSGGGGDRNGTWHRP